MPRFHFTLGDSVTYLDPDGSEFQDLDAARNEALRYAGEWLRDHPNEMLRDGALQVTVSDEAGLTLFMVTTIATNSPATSL